MPTNRSIDKIASSISTRSVAGRSAVTSLPRWGLTALPYWPVALLIPGAVLSGAIARGGVKRWRVPIRTRRVLAPMTAAAVLLGLSLWQLGRIFTEKPRYQVERRIGPLEIRRYEPRLVAETSVEEADWSAALSEGFRRLARYIFGANEGRQRIAMTSPVTASHAAPGERIAMTSPVTASTAHDGIRHTVAFTMPRDRDLASLPKPKDERVVFREVPSRRVAVLRFHGTYRPKRIEPKKAELLRRVREAGLTPLGEPMFAGYDAPSTLPLLRRVEVWVEVA